MTNSYNPTKWVEYKTVATANVMNNIEKGIVDVHERVDEVDSQIKDIENKLQCHIECFRAKGDTDTDVFLKACKSGKTVILDSKEYNIEQKISMDFSTEFIGSNKTIIKCNNNLDSLFELGHSCKLKSLKIIYNGNINNVISINTEHLEKSISNVNIYDFVSDKALLSIHIDDIKILNNSTSYTDDTAIQIYSNGYGLNGWGIKITNIELQGCFDFGITYINNQTNNNGTSSCWITDIKIDDIKMIKVKNGFLFDSYNSTANGKAPNVPQMIKITGASLQYHTNADRFAIINSGKNVYFNECMPWDFNRSSNKPYLVNADNVSDLKISNIFTYGVEYITSDSSITTNDFRGNEGVISGSFSTLPTKEGNYTLRDLHLLNTGSYRIPMDDSYSTKLGLPTETFSYGGSVYVFGGYRGLKTIMVVPSNIKWGSTKSFKFNKSIFILNLSLELKATTSQNTKDFLNTELTRECWYEFKDVNDSSVQNGSTENRPVLEYSKRGYLYYDTTLQKLIYWTGNAWKTVAENNQV